MQRMFISYRGKAVLAGHTSTAVFLFRNFGWRATKPQGNQAANNQCYVTQNAFAHLCSNSSRPQSVPCNIEYRSTIPPEASLPAAIRSICHQAPQSKACQNRETR